MSHMQVMIILLASQLQKKRTVQLQLFHELCNRAWVTELQLPWAQLSITASEGHTLPNIPINIKQVT